MFLVDLKKEIKRRKAATPQQNTEKQKGGRATGKKTALFENSGALSCGCLDLAAARTALRESNSKVTTGDGENGIAVC